MLALLVGRPGQVVTKDELLAAGWPGSFVSEDSLTDAVSLIRGALRDDAQSPRYLQTVPRRGYRFVAEVRAPGPGWQIARIGVQPFVVEPGDDPQLLRFAGDVAAAFADLLERDTRAGAVQLEGIGWRPLASEEEATLRQDASRARQDRPDDPVVLVAQALPGSPTCLPRTCSWTGASATG